MVIVRSHVPMPEAKKTKPEWIGGGKEEGRRGLNRLVPRSNPHPFFFDEAFSPRRHVCEHVWQQVITGHVGASRHTPLRQKVRALASLNPQNSGRHNDIIYPKPRPVDARLPSQAKPDSDGELTAWRTHKRRRVLIHFFASTRSCYVRGLLPVARGNLPSAVFTHTLSCSHPPPWIPSSRFSQPASAHFLQYGAWHAISLFVAGSLFFFFFWGLGGKGGCTYQL
jgi:hypothetical protein